jgi:hypothetical protein
MQKSKNEQMNTLHKWQQHEIYRWIPETYVQISWDYPFKGGTKLFIGCLEAL